MSAWMDENLILLLLFAICMFGIGMLAAWLADWLEKHYPWNGD